MAAAASMEMDIEPAPPRQPPQSQPVFIGNGPGAGSVAADEEGDEDGLSSSLPSSEGGSRNSRLARKAESARQARLRHKQFVTDLQDQAAGLQARISELEAHCTTGPGSAAVAVRELKEALKPEQLEQLRSWLVAAQGENHVLAKYENGAALPPPAAQSLSRTSLLGGAAPSGSSAPIAIGGSSKHWRQSAAPYSMSPMMDGEDGAFPLSRSWDDCEVARSILNLNSPNGFHPQAISSSLPPPGSFMLPTASSSAPPPLPFGAGGSSLLGKPSAPPSTHQAASS